MSHKKSLTLPLKKATKHELLVCERAKFRYDFSSLRQWITNLKEKKEQDTPDLLRSAKPKFHVPYQALVDLTIDDDEHGCSVSQVENDLVG